MSLNIRTSPSWHAAFKLSLPFVEIYYTCSISIFICRKNYPTRKLYSKCNIYKSFLFPYSISFTHILQHTTFFLTQGSDLLHLQPQNYFHVSKIPYVTLRQITVTRNKTLQYFISKICIPIP